MKTYHVNITFWGFLGLLGSFLLSITLVAVWCLLLVGVVFYIGTEGTHSNVSPFALLVIFTGVTAFTLLVLYVFFRQVKTITRVEDNPTGFNVIP